MRSWVKLRTLAVVMAGAAAAGGCSSAPTASPLPAAASPSPAARGGPAGYWTQSRRLAATPWREPGYQPGPPASAPAPAPGVRVGALFEHDASGNHFCTASVVASPGRNLLITAAHCINGGKSGGYRQDIVFIPGYRDGQAPQGIWTPARLVVAPQWANSSDPDFDVGFVVLKPEDGKNIEDVLGADRLGIDPGYRNQVRVTGYPASADAPITCTGWTAQQSSTQLRFECDGFTGGTSGSPWVTDVDSQTGTGTIVGVLGGYQEGGSTAAISYSPYLGAQVEQLYHQAVADEAAQ
jgi:V8-like Glu-specific endopeptidase